LFLSTFKQMGLDKK
jgi:hypothetical protein